MAFIAQAYQSLLAKVKNLDKLEDNAGPFTTLFYCFSIFYCMTTSLALGGDGLGTARLPESKLREFCKEAGFGQVQRLPVNTALNILYEIKL